MLGMVDNYWTLFEEFRPLSENSSPPLVSQAVYGPESVCHLNYYTIAIKIYYKPLSVQCLWLRLP